jgi:hypothetical protein
MGFDDEKRAELNYIISNVPVLYKYSRKESFESIISNSSIAFKNPTLFNDPFDCYPDLINFNNIPSNFRQYLIKKYKHLLSPDRIRNIEYSSDDEIAGAFRDSAFPTELSSTVISCFSEQFDNFLMWSHYSNSHKGVCIGFNLRVLYLNLKEYHPALIKVKYTNEFVPIDYFGKPKEAIANWYRIKSECWSYENEIRIALTNIKLDSTKQIYIPIRLDTICSVYLGSNIESTDEREIRLICSEKLPKAKVFRMRLKPNSFNLVSE